MTKSRAPLTVAQALTRAGGCLTWEAITRITGRAVRTMQNWSDPDTSASVPIEQALAIDVACMAAGDPPHLFRWYASQLDLADAGQREARAAIAASGAIAAKEVGEAAAATLRAVYLGDRASIAIAERENAEAVDALSNHLHDIRASARGDLGEES